jgi:flagellar basal-body rod protein FlgB
MNDITTTPLMRLLQSYLDVTSQRHKLVVSNMANIDTPGYRTKDIDFRGELERATANAGADFMPIARSVPGLLERPDGNNVSLDREGLLMAETQMQYALGVEFLRHEFSNLMLAIHEGNKS